MARLTIYGPSRSRTRRVLWMARELGLDFEQVPLDLASGDQKATAFLAVNPNGKVPAIDDDGLRLCESCAINLYLAGKHGGPLAPADAAEYGRALQWSFWAVTEVEPSLLLAFQHRLLLPAAQRDAAKAAEAEAKLAQPLGVLEATLRDRPYLLGDRFTVADLNVVGVVGVARFFGFDLGAWPAVSAWLTRCVERPAAKAAMSFT